MFKGLAHLVGSKLLGQKKPVSASAMLTGKFLRILKVFATSSLLAEEFPNILKMYEYYTKYPDMQSIRKNWKVSG